MSLLENLTLTDQLIQLIRLKHHRPGALLLPPSSLQTSLPERPPSARAPPVPKAFSQRPTWLPIYIPSPRQSPVSILVLLGPPAGFLKARRNVATFAALQVSSARHLTSAVTWEVVVQPATIHAVSVGTCAARSTRPASQTQMAKRNAPVLGLGCLPVAMLAATFAADLAKSATLMHQQAPVSLRRRLQRRLHVRAQRQSIPLPAPTKAPSSRQSRWCLRVSKLVWKQSSALQPSSHRYSYASRNSDRSSVGQYAVYQANSVKLREFVRARDVHHFDLHRTQQISRPRLSSRRRQPRREHAQKRPELAEV